MVILEHKQHAGGDSKIKCECKTIGKKVVRQHKELNRSGNEHSQSAEAKQKPLPRPATIPVKLRFFGESHTSHALYAGTKTQSKNRTAKKSVSRQPPPTIKVELIASLTVI